MIKYLDERYLDPAEELAKLKYKLKSLGGLLVGGTITACCWAVYKGDEKFYREILMPSIRYVDAEKAHRMAVLLLKYKLYKGNPLETTTLPSQVMGLKFKNPIGMAAGFDKHGEAVESLLQNVGCGFTEVGTITPLPQDGNEKPRVFRLSEDQAVINRYGFNSEGHEVVYERLKHSNLSDKKMGIIGINLGKNKTTVDPSVDYVLGIEKFGDLADYFVINISSPNTPGLRNLQKKELLESLLDSLIKARDRVNRNVPLVLKIAPDLTQSEIEDIADAVYKRKNRLQGIIVSNTTITRPDTLQSEHKHEAGGLSGRPLKELSTLTISQIYKLTNGEIPIIGVGGVETGEDAYDKIKNGASLIQLYTSMVFHGPPIIAKINRELDEKLKSEGYSSVSEAVGKAIKL